MTPRLSNIIVSVAFLFSISGCNSDKHNIKEFEGDLYFNWLHFGNFYNEPDSIIKKVKEFVDTVNTKLLDSSSLRIYKMYEILKKEDLLYRPFIDLKLDNDSIIKIYFVNDDYEKIKIYKRQELLDKKQKIRVKIEGRKLGYGMVLATKLLAVTKIDGQTFQINPKMKIEDYR